MTQFLRPLSLALVFTLTSYLGHDLVAQQTASSEIQLTSEVEVSARIVDRIDDSHLTILGGSHLRLARTSSDRGQVDADLKMGDLFLILHRSPDAQKAFDQFVASQYDATSSNFHVWLTAEQIGERFGPATADIQNLASWLRSEGFTVDEIAKDRIYLRFSGTARQVQAAFHTEIHTFDVKGSAHLANTTDVSIPSALAPVVAGVRGLHNFYARPLHRLGQRVMRNAQTGAWQRTSAAPSGPVLNPLLAPSARPKPLLGTTDTYGDVIEDVAPFDFAAIYNVLPLWQKTSPIDGTGQAIAIAGTSNINLADVAAFRTSFGLPVSAAANTPRVIVTNSDPGNCSNFADSCFGDLIENTLDVEWSGAVAKGASIILVTSSAPTASTDPLYLSENYIVQNKTASIMNVSYGGCELALGNAGNTQYNNLWQTAAAEGISVFVASGDSGSPACDQGFDAVDGVPYGAQFGLTINGIASTPYDTAVGGTDLNWGSAAAPYWNSTNSATTGASAVGYIPEVPWNSTCTNPLIFATLAGDAAAIGASPVTDAESACNFVIVNYASIEANYGVQLAGLVDTIGGGGGSSDCTNSSGYVGSCTGGYAKPSWQTGVSGIPADNARDIPDVSFFASNGFLGSSYLICVSGAGACTYSALAEPSAQEVGGTSVASPAMAGIMALINQKTGGAQGNPNPTLYALAATQNYSGCSTESATAGGSCLFNDIDTGTIAMVCQSGSADCNTLTAGDAAGVLSGYATGKGYDLATGLGSLNVTNVVNKWPVINAPLVALSPTSLSFPSTVQGVASASKSVTLTNSGKSSLSISSYTFTGANASSFSQTNNCPSSLAPAGACTVNVTFKPAALGSLSAALSIADSAYDSPQSVALTGTSTAPVPSAAFSAQSISFGSTAVGATKTATATLMNAGSAALALTGISLTGPNATAFTQTNTCGTSVAAGGSCTVTINFKPMGAGSLTATLQAVDNAGDSPQTIALSGTATGGTTPTLTFSPGSVTFASTAVGSTATQLITIKNTGSSAVSFTATTTVTGTNASSFAKTASTCPNPLPAAASCTNTISFTPTATGILTGVVTYTDTAAGSPQTVPLSGTGGAGASTLTFNPNPLTFASTAVGTTTSQLITIKNTGSSAVSFTATTTVTGTNASSFAKTASTCSNPLPAGASCTNTISFTPTTTGTLSGVVTYTDTAAGSPQTVALSGTGGNGASTLTFTPSPLTFASTSVGSTISQLITIKNTGSSAVSFTATTTVTGANASSFAKTASTCPNPLPPGASCTNTISFTPTTTGTLAGVVTYTDTAAGSPQTVSLSGTGASTGPELTFSPTSLTFASVTVGTTSSQLITIKNTGSSAVTFTATTTITGANASSFAKTASTCTNPLPAGSSCTNTISFTPTTTGALAATVTYTDSAAGSPQTVALSGNGAAAGGSTLTFSPSPLAFAATTVGTTTTGLITIKNTGSSAVTFTAITTVTGTNASSFVKTASTCTNPLPAGSSCTNTISFTPTAIGNLNAVVTYTDTATGSPQTVGLSGTGK